MPGNCNTHCLVESVRIPVPTLKTRTIEDNNTDTADLLVDGLANALKLDITIYIVGGENVRKETHSPRDGNIDHSPAFMVLVSAIVFSQLNSSRTMKPVCRRRRKQ